MSDDLVTISAKVPRGLRDKLDGIGDDLGLSNRSVLIRKALESFVESHGSVGIPPVESKIDEGRRGNKQTERCSVYRAETRLLAQQARKGMGRSDDR